MKQLLKVIVAIVILIAVGYGVYLILPDYPHDFVKSVVQPIVDVEAKTRITQVQNMSVGIKELDGVTYKTALEKNNGSNCWVYDKDETTGQETVVYRGNGAPVNMKDYSDYNGKLYTSASVKFEFIITGNSVEIIPYLNDTKMNIKDGAHVEQNKEVLQMIVSQLYGGMEEE